MTVSFPSAEMDENGRRLAVSAPPGEAHLHGTWSYEPPGPSSADGYGRYRFGQYLYASGAACEHNMTVHVGGAAFWSCSTQFLANASYLESHECIPDALMMPAYITDRINEMNVLPKGACLQLTAQHYDYFAAVKEDFSADVVEAASRPPTKHGLVSSIHPDPTYAMAAAAALVGFPHIDGNWMGADNMRHSDAAAFPTLLRTLSDSRGHLAGVFDLLPDRFALLSDDSPGSGVQIDVIRKSMATRGRQLTPPR